MGTRSLISIEGFNLVSLYKHWDGYPEAMLPWLEKFNAAFTRERGVDPEYKVAQLLRSSVRDAKEFDLDESLATGWGLVEHDSDWGQEFSYLLMNDGSVTFKEV